MELNKIEALLEKYLNAETSIKEEQELKEYFCGDNVAPHLQEYVPLFNYFGKQKEIKFSEKHESRFPQRSQLYSWFAVAASIAIIAGVFLFENYQKEPELGTYEDPELALQKTKEVLNLVSHYMNEGQEDLVYLKEIGRTTSKFIKTP